MQFKKHFSSNLQNLSVKKTVVMEPPPQLAHDLSLHSHLATSRQSRSPIPTHRHCPSALSEISSADKENNTHNNLLPSNLSECRSSSRVKGPTMQEYPILTFQAIKEGFAEREQLKPKKPLESNDPNSLREEKSLKLKQCSSLAFLEMNRRQSKISNNVRLGSMVFSSLSQRDGEEGSRKWQRESRSYERKANRHVSQIECMNKDGRPAKYKIAKVDTDEQAATFHYCFNCAIPLVKQGFIVQELSTADKEQLSSRRNSYHQPGQQRTYQVNSNKSHQGQDERLKLGQKVKTKVLLKINKVKQSREDFEALVASSADRLDFYYDSLVSFVEEERLRSHKELLRIKNGRKPADKWYEQQLNSALGTIDYLLRHPQGLADSCLQQIQQLLETEDEPQRLRPVLHSRQDLAEQLETFGSYFRDNFRVRCSIEGDGVQYQRRRYTQGNQGMVGSQNEDRDSIQSNPFRYSFESALRESRSSKTRKPVQTCFQMNPLVEESESELEESLKGPEKRRDAFRNLFPEEGEEVSFEAEENVQSPIFKEF